MFQHLNRGIKPSKITTPLDITHNFSGLSAMFSGEHSSKYTQFDEVSKKFHYIRQVIPASMDSSFR